MADEGRGTMGCKKEKLRRSENKKNRDTMPAGIFFGM